MKASAACQAGALNEANGPEEGAWVDADLYYTKLKMAYTLDASHETAPNKQMQQQQQSLSCGSADQVLATLDAISNEFRAVLANVCKDASGARALAIHARNELAHVRYQTHQKDVREHNRVCGDGTTGMCFEVSSNSAGWSPDELDSMSLVLSVARL